MKFGTSLGVIFILPFASLVARADTDESIANRAERYLRDRNVFASLPENDSSTVPEKTLVIFKLASGGSQGVAAPIAKVVRYKSYLFLHDTFGNVSMVPYFTDSGANDDFRRVAAGQSINVGGCMDFHEELKQKAEVLSIAGQTCILTHYSLSAQCTTLTPVPLLSGVSLSNYKMQDIERDPLEGIKPSCYGN